MDGNTSRELTRLWSQLPHLQASLHGLLAHLHDVSLSALAAAIAMLGVVMLLELRSVARLRQAVDGRLARVFEQLDLMRLDSRPPLQERLTAEPRPASPAPPPAATLQPPLPSAVRIDQTIAGTMCTTAERIERSGLSHQGLSSGEARLLSSLAEARARRAAAGAVRA